MGGGGIHCADAGTADFEELPVRDIKEMAREVKMPYDFVTGEPINIEKLEAFAALVRADALAARNTVPDAIGPDEGEPPEYIAGWNDCRALMLEMRKP